jgi:phosphohistidine phosphatase
MRRLLLLRHAKAERTQPDGKDHERVLTDRGRADAVRLGTYLARHALTPDQVLVSTSARTRETWTQIGKVLDGAPKAQFEERVYDASPQTILAVIHGASAKAGTVLIIGHNPGLQELAATLIASGDVEARQRLKEEFPTAAVAVISFAIDDWRGVHPLGGRLEHFVSPKWLEAATD